MSFLARRKAVVAITAFVLVAAALLPGRREAPG